MPAKHAMLQHKIFWFQYSTYAFPALSLHLSLHSCFLLPAWSFKMFIGFIHLLQLLTHFNWMAYGYLLCYMRVAFDWQRLLSCCCVACDWPPSIRLLYPSRPIARLLGDTSHSAHARVDRQPPHPLIKPANLTRPPNRLHAYTPSRSPAQYTKVQHHLYS